MQRVILSLLHGALAFKLCTASPSEQQHIVGTCNTLPNDWNALKEARIIPDVLDDFTPSCRLQVLYPNSHKEVLMGNTLEVSDAEHAPVVRAVCPGVAEDDAQYIIVLTDPDAPSRDDPKWSEYCHWIAKLPRSGILEIPLLGLGKRRTPRNKEVSNELIKYNPPAPPKKTGRHRYVFVLLNGDSSNLTAPSERKNWGTGKERHGVRAWAKNESLSVVGANFFYAQNEKQ